MVIHFYAEEKSKGRFTVFLKCYISGQSVKFYPKIQCEGWDKKSERATGFNKANINDILNQLKLKAYDIEHALKRENRLTKTNFEKLLKGEGQRDFFSCFTEFINESRTRVNSTTGEKLVSKTIDHYRSCLAILTEFNKEYPITFESMDMKFYGRFRTYFMGLGRNQNTFGGKIRMIKTFLTWASYQGITVNPIYKKFERPQKYSDAEPLTGEQLEKLWKMKLELNPELREPLDIFLFLCSTGLRISDYNNLKPENFKEDHIKIHAQKTSGECVIPFFDDHYFRPKYIYDKYKGKLPKLVGQKLNPMLTQIGRMAKLNIDITSKTGRKTFATLKLLSGVNAFTIMRSTGHKDYKSFTAYVGISPEDVIKENRDKATFLKAI
jgi:integrase